MTGIYDDEGRSAARESPAVLSAWIRELLGDVQRAQVRRLAELRAQFQSEAFEWDGAALAQAVSTLHSAGRECHFERLRPGWFDRLTGRYRAAHARFVAAYERMVACAARLKMDARELAQQLRGHTAGARRVLVELDMEWKALQAEVDQGVNWLQDMCEQLGELRARGADDPQLAMLAEAAQAFTQEFKRLQSAASLAREIGVRAQALLERRAALLEHVRADGEAFDKSWMQAIGKVVGDIKAARAALPGVAQALAAHDELMKRLEARADACFALQQEEHIMAQHLGLLREALEPRR
jgi:hypothetical protein